ncbi:MAG TPA: MBL fold metallo-hydrolase, partial [Gaiellaceae bacterium]
MSLKLTVVGCSPAWPNPGGAQSGYLLEGPGRLLLDCGPGVLAKLRQHESWPSVDAIAITHWHLDHWGDLVPWVWGSRSPQWSRCQCVIAIASTWGQLSCWRSFARTPGPQSRS